MKNFIPAFVMVLALVVAGMAFFTPNTTTQAAADEPAALAAPSLPAAPVEATPIATLDPVVIQYQATAVEADRQVIFSRQTAVSAQETQVAYGVDIKREENRGIELEQTRQVNEQNLLSVQATKVSNEKTILALQDAQLERIHQREMESQKIKQKTSENITLGIVACFVLIIVGLFGTVWVLNLRKPVETEEEQEEEPVYPLAAAREYAQVQVTSQVNGNMEIRVDDWTGIATQNQLLAVARGVLMERKTLAISKWYGTDESGNKLPFTRAEFEKFIEAITSGVGAFKTKLAYKVSGHAVLNNAGRDYFQNLLWSTEPEPPPSPTNLSQ